VPTELLNATQGRERLTRVKPTITPDPCWNLSRVFSSSFPAVLDPEWLSKTFIGHQKVNVAEYLPANSSLFLSLAVTSLIW
jgi:hypothetical protein